MAVYTQDKDPQEVIDYTIDWSDHLASGETISTSTWTFPNGSSELIEYMLPYDGQTVNFVVGGTVTGATSGATGVIVSDDDSGTSGTLHLKNLTGTFVDNETITGSTGGSATSKLDGRFTADTATVWLSGGTAGEEYTVKNTITTSAGRTIEKTLVVPVLQD